ncbi:MAG: DUF3090 family protein [Acidimicrobiia bacterium]
MSRFDLDPVDRFTAGAVGEPGHRVFYLQVEAGGGPAVSFKLEKTQVAALAGYLAQLLADLPTPDPGDAPTDLELEEPVLEEWVVGTIGVAYDDTASRFLVRLDELRDDEGDGEPDGADDEDDDEAGTARLGISRGQAHAFVVRAAVLVSSGRPACPLCGRPIDPEGHLCVKTNGHKH